MKSELRSCRCPGRFQRLWTAVCATVGVASLLVPSAPAQAPAGGGGASFRPVDLSGFKTCRLGDGAAGDAWQTVPVGRQTLGGVPFQIDGLVEVTGLDAARAGDFDPPRIDGLPVGGQPRRLHLLLGSIGGEDDGAPLATLVLRFADGKTRELRLGYGVQMRNSFTPRNERNSALSDPHSRVVWTSKADEWDRSSYPLRLFATAFDNPRPGAEIRSIDFVSLFSRATPFLLGLTTEEGPPLPAPPEAPRRLARRANDWSDAVYRRQFVVRASDAAEGRPLTNATAHLTISDDRSSFYFGSAAADADGRIALDYPPQHTLAFSLLVTAPNRIPATLAGSRTNSAAEFRDELAAKLERGVSIGGVVKDPEGKPLPGATVVVCTVKQEGSRRFLEIDYDSAQTDALGKWSSTAVPPDFTGFQFEVTHPDFRPTRYVQEGTPGTGATASPRMRLLDAESTAFAEGGIMPVESFTRVELGTPVGALDLRSGLVPAADPPRAAAPGLINIDFGASAESPKDGPAAMGAANDFWNSFSRESLSGGWQSIGTANNLLLADGSPSRVSITVSNAPGAWGNKASDPMYDSYLYPLNNGDIWISVANLWVGQYDLYLYGHEADDSRRCAYDLTVGTTRYGSRTNGPGWNLSEWKEGAQYVVFRSVRISSPTDRPVIVARRSHPPALPVIAGMQIKPSGPAGQIAVQSTDPVALRGNVRFPSLAANAVAPCVPPPPGLVAWWPLDGARDIWGQSPVSSYAGLSFTAGKVGLGVRFDGQRSYGRALAKLALNVGMGPGFTIEGWIKTEDPTRLAMIMEWTGGAYLATSAATNGGGGPGALFANLVDTTGASHPLVTAAGLLAANQFQHVAWTYDKASGSAALYLDGANVAQTNLGSFTPRTTSGLCFGYKASGPLAPARFAGMMDEFSLYNRALASTEIQAIAKAGAAGKCRPPSAPDRVPVIGEPLTFDASGRPLRGPAPRMVASFTPLSKEDLLAGKAEMVLQPAIRVLGLVADESGQAVAKADVFLLAASEASEPTATCKTDVAGKFSFKVLNPMDCAVAVLAPGFAPRHQVINPGVMAGPLQVTLQKARPLSGRVRDQTGEPIADALVHLDPWHNTQLIRWQARTDAEGRFTWDNPPQDQVTFSISASNCYTMRHSIGGGFSGEFSATLRKPLMAFGQVVDADTGKPIEQFTLTQGYQYQYSSPSRINWLRYNIYRGRNGQYSMRLNDYGSATNYVMIEAPGYLPAKSGPFRSAGWNTNNFALKKGRGLGGVVQLASGEPAPNGTLVLAVAGESPSMSREGQLNISGNRGDQARSDRQGRFEFAPRLDALRVFAAHDTGYAEVNVADLQKTGKVALTPWGRVTGAFRIGPANWAGRSVVLHSPSSYYGDDSETPPELSLYLRAQTDASGQFTFERVPPGWRQASVEYRVERGDESYSCYSHSVPVEVQPGQTAQVALGEKGRTVLGRITFTGGLPADTVDWRRNFHMLSSRLPPMNLQGPTFTAGMTDEERQRVMAEYEKRQRSFWRSPEGRALSRRQRSYALLFETNGAFRIESVPPGTYDLNINLNEREEEDGSINYRNLGSLNREVIVPEAPAGQPDAPFDLGGLSMTIRRPLRVGQPAPLFEAKTLDGQTVKLGSFRGTNVLLYFHATWAGVYSTEIEGLRYLHNTFGTNGGLAVIGMNVDHERKAAEDFTRNNRISWLQCYVGPWSEATIPGMFGVEGVPTAIFIGADGRVRNKNLRGSSIRSVVSNMLRAEPAAALRLNKW